MEEDDEEGGGRALSPDAREQHLLATVDANIRSPPELDRDNRGHLICEARFESRQTIYQTLQEQRSYASPVCGLAVSLAKSAMEQWPW